MHYLGSRGRDSKKKKKNLNFGIIVVPLDGHLACLDMLSNQINIRTLHIDPRSSPFFHHHFAVRSIASFSNFYSLSLPSALLIAQLLFGGVLLTTCATVAAD
ncbi:hypothetical protein ACJX0J_010002 [Zea mays]